MQKEKNEFEIIRHPRIEHLNVFFVNLIKRTTHLHGDLELCYIMRGKLRIRTKTRDFTACPGSLLLFNFSEPHSLNRIEGSPVLLTIQISKSFFKESFPDFENILFLTNEVLNGLTPEARSEIVAELYALTENYFGSRFGFELKVLSKVYSLVYAVFQTTPYKLIDKEDLLKEKERQIRLAVISEYIRNHLGERITLQETAASVGLSSNYFSHFFRDNFNITFQEYISDLRFEKAVKLISRTNLKMLDISLECGFSDTKYMNQAFRRNCSQLPKEYRRNLKEKSYERGTEERVKGHTTQYIYRQSDEISGLIKRLKDLAELF